MGFLNIEYNFKLDDVYNVCPLIRKREKLSIKSLSCTAGLYTSTIQKFEDRTCSLTIEDLLKYITGLKMNNTIYIIVDNIVKDCLYIDWLYSDDIDESIKYFINVLNMYYIKAEKKKDYNHEMMFRFNKETNIDDLMKSLKHNNIVLDFHLTKKESGDKS